MDILQYLICKTHMLYIELIFNLSPANMQNLYIHPCYVLGAWGAKKVGLDSLSKKIVKKAVDSVGTGIKSINKGLEEKL